MQTTHYMPIVLSDTRRKYLLICKSLNFSRPNLHKVGASCGSTVKTSSGQRELLHLRTMGSELEPARQVPVPAVCSTTRWPPAGLLSGSHLGTLPHCLCLSFLIWEMG